MLTKLKSIVFILFTCLLGLSFFAYKPQIAIAEKVRLSEKTDFVAKIKMNMIILTGTQKFLESSIKKAERDGAKALIVELDTPGGVLQTTQEMVQAIFKAKIPIIVYITPTGATATSAGVFITMAGHIAAMSPGTTIGAAHPVQGDGKDIEGDMRKKAENATVSMVKAITEERGRNLEWAEKAVLESSSITEKEALEKNVIDIIAPEIKDLLKSIKGKKIKLDGQDLILEDFSELPITEYEIHFQDKILNVLGHPSVVALLWLAATTGISIELYNPGSIFPGVVGVICLLLALAVSQVIPITQTGVLLMVVGVLMIGAELFIPSGIFAVGGIIAIIFGAIYLIDPNEAPNIQVSLEFIIPMAILVGVSMLWIMREVFGTYRKRPSTGQEGLIKKVIVVDDNLIKSNLVFVNGEYWSFRIDKDESDQSQIKPGDSLMVSEVQGLVLILKKIDC